MKSKGFLETFFSEFNFNKWIKIIDWLLDDEKFVEWTRNELKSFVIEYKKISCIEQGLYVYDRKNVANPTFYDRKRNRKRKSIIIMVTGQGEAKDLVRHIRNGIAHGRAKLCTRNGVRCLEISDFGKYGDPNERGGQTAYLLFPVTLIEELYKIYEKVH